MMRHLGPATLAAVCICAGVQAQTAPPAQNPDTFYKLGPDSLEQDGVPTHGLYQNVRLMQALSKKGYDVNYSWGMNRHGQAMGGAILPEMMRWLWRDHPVSTDVNDAVERSFHEPKPKATP